jgi:phosphoribosylanthranilate isomerase
VATWIKICGTTSLADAQAAADAGADALGFIFAPSPRRIEPERAAEIIARLPARVEKIGVFVNDSPERMLVIARQAGLTGLQLHGDEDAESVRTLHARAPQLALYKAVAATNEIQIAAFLQPTASACLRALMLDSGSAARRGGTGQTFDWKATLPKMDARLKIIIAGGLTAQNVGEPMRTFRPFGVDVVTGVESEPGVKDPAALKAFIAAVRTADGE